ncbi:MAG: hypothetical protein F6K23_34245 [Okeania sp. SIO2C9]|uniref:hypothetical protein n=1 Tax=Okeania sp. SIO2C9 TaxID=2607791 RepID=UPI0013C05B71|nr:hypothetical protein [Okeania sp. SIO2C9]NEQ77632.1 hypothetical protein [Okeania sp. SIO2C9]
MVGRDKEHLEPEQDAPTGYTVTKIKIKYGVGELLYDINLNYLGDRRQETGDRSQEGGKKKKEE